MILLYLAVSAAYLAAARLEWQRLTQPAPAAMPRRAVIAPWLTGFALIGHAFLVTRAIAFSGTGLDFSLANALSAVVGLTAMFAWIGSFTRALPGVTIVALPMAAAAVWMPLLLANPHQFSLIDEPWAALHIAVALIAYGLLIVATLEALILMSFDKRLRRGISEPSAAELPPLLTLERFLFRVVGAGFALLTLTLLTGVFFSEELFGKPLTFNHKTVFSVLAWIAYGALLVGRHRFGWRGRKALNWILFGGAMLLLAYIGSKFVLEVLLRR